MSGPVLITGGAGSVGRILVSRLRQDGLPVRVFDLPIMNYTGLEGADGIEVIKAARMGLRGIMDHILSMVLFVVMLVEFLLVARAGTSTFFLLMTMSFVELRPIVFSPSKSGNRLSASVRESRM